MCLVVFVGACAPLSAQQRQEGEWTCGLYPLQNESLAVRRLFSCPYVYEAATSEGCGCGFGYDKDESNQVLNDARVPDEIKALESSDFAARQQDVGHLRESMASGLDAGDVELYACWIGSESQEPLLRKAVSISVFGGDSFHLVEREFLTISR